MSSSQYPVIKGTLHSSDSFTWNTADSLGRGASAIVYLGRNKLNGQVVAVKVFHEHLLSSFASSSDLSELSLLRQLNHTNIISLHAIEKELSTMQPVLVMEYCEGGSLHFMIDQPQYYYGLDEEMFLLVLNHVSSGIQYLRRQNIVHRDIKPGNIMRFITLEGESIFKLTDFGAARNLDEDESFQSLYGTEEYLHPRIYERAVLRASTNHSFDARVDLWSLGVTFYHTATGKLPFVPYGGRSNKRTMFDIITRKQRGTISGVQETENGEIKWSSELPDSCPLSSGLQTLVIPLLAGLMEPDDSYMITYEGFFSIVEDMHTKMTIEVFHVNQCENLVLYVEKNTVLSSLQDEIAAKTDIIASDQILLVGGKSLDEVVDPQTCVENYPPELLKDSIFLYNSSMSEGHYRLSIPKIPPFPDIAKYSDMDMDARHAHSCSARSELFKRYTERVSKDQEQLVKGIHYFRIYIEGLLQGTKPCQGLMKDLLSVFKAHCDSFFGMVKIIKDLVKDRHPKDGMALDTILGESIIRPVHSKATERINEIRHYSELLEKKLDEISLSSANLHAACKKEKCVSKVMHHVGVISTIQNRFRRDKNVKHQMTSHDENIHRFERQKLQFHCASLDSILNSHCYPERDRLFVRSLQMFESLSKCLNRVRKVEKNIKSVLNCENLLSDKMNTLASSCQLTLSSMTESGFVSSGSLLKSRTSLPSASLPSAGAQATAASNVEENKDFSDRTKRLEEKLLDLRSLIEDNNVKLRSLDEPLSVVDHR